MKHVHIVLNSVILQVAAIGCYDSDLDYLTFGIRGQDSGQISTIAIVFMIAFIVHKPNTEMVHQYHGPEVGQLRDSSGSDEGQRRGGRGQQIV